VTDATPHRVTIAAVIFYKQHPDRLHRLVTSLAGRCQGIVALDGPYHGLSTEPQSPRDNYEALYDACASKELDCAIWQGRIWSGEPQKRTAAAREAHILGSHRTSNPWLLVIDSDEWLLTDIDWTKVSQHGTAILHNYTDDKPDPGTAGDGSKMVRLYPNTPELVWGPAHFDVRDIGKRHTYSGWEKGLANDDDPAFTIAHDQSNKLIKAEYDAYNDGLRIKAEGKMMRVVQDYTTGDKIVIRMDTEQIAAGEWRVGTVVQFDGALLGREEDGFARVSELVQVPGIEALDIHMVRMDDDESARKLIEVNARRKLAEDGLRDEALRRRAAKRARRR
jgi:hypothetical protein